MQGGWKIPHDEISGGLDTWINFTPTSTNDKIPIKITASKCFSESCRTSLILNFGNSTTVPNLCGFLLEKLKI